MLRVRARRDAPLSAAPRSLGGGAVCPGMLCPHAAPGARASRQCTDALDRALVDPVARREHRPSGVFLEFRSSGVVPGDRSGLPPGGGTEPPTTTDAAVLTDRPAGPGGFRERLSRHGRPGRQLTHLLLQRLAGGAAPLADAAGGLPGRRRRPPGSPRDRRLLLSGVTPGPRARRRAPPPQSAGQPTCEHPLLGHVVPGPPSPGPVRARRPVVRRPPRPPGG